MKKSATTYKRLADLNWDAIFGLFYSNDRRGAGLVVKRPGYGYARSHRTRSCSKEDRDRVLPVFPYPLSCRFVMLEAFRVIEPCFNRVSKPPVATIPTVQTMKPKCGFGCPFLGFCRFGYSTLRRSFTSCLLQAACAAARFASSTLACSARSCGDGAGGATASAVGGSSPLESQCHPINPRPISTTRPKAPY